MDFEVADLVYLIVACLGSVCTCILSFLNLKRSGTTKKEVLSLCEKTDNITKQIPTEDKKSAQYLDEFFKAAQKVLSLCEKTDNITKQIPTEDKSGVSWKELLEKEVLSLCEKTDNITKQIPTEDKKSAQYLDRFSWKDDSYLDEFSKAAQTLNDSGVSWKELLETLNNRFYGGLKK